MEEINFIKNDDGSISAEVTVTKTEKFTETLTREFIERQLTQYQNNLIYLENRLTEDQSEEELNSIKRNIDKVQAKINYYKELLVKIEEQEGIV